MFRIKIGGLTSVDDAAAVVEAGADAIGLNFYARSPRFVPHDSARDIVRAIGPRACKVGLFVNSPAEEITEIYDELGLDLIQLHGDESPDILRELAPRPVMRAFRVGPDGLRPVRRWMEASLRMSLFPKLVLFDAYQPGQYGATGTTTDWSLARAYREKRGMPPLVLAGGLKGENVAEAIAAVGPAAVDVAGGVERAPGRKDHDRVREFVAAARAAFLLGKTA